LVLLALVREADGAYDDAAACFRLALRMDPGSEETLQAFVGFSARRLLADRAWRPGAQPQKLA
jgi:hypothetical protein